MVNGDVQELLCFLSRGRWSALPDSPGVPAVLLVVPSGRDRKQGVDLHSTCGHMSPSVTGLFLPHCSSAFAVPCLSTEETKAHSENITARPRKDAQFSTQGQMHYLWSPT